MITNEQFEEASVPHSWLLVADNLHEQAVKVRELGGTSALSYSIDGESQWTIESSNRASFLLAGFALENVLKGFLVYENSCWIKNGKLNGELTSHELTALADKLHNIELFTTEEARMVLASFEEGLTSWARYPCGLNKSSTSPEKALTDSIWLEYIQLMSDAGKEFKKLLRNNWKGPHKFKGHYVMKGDWLGNVD